jgi:POT family proton-dependent oligopeptide transporter
MRWFGGHPKGLAYLAFTELWERFSYYAMTGLLMLYMVKQLLRPEHAVHVIGLAPLRHLFEWGGPISDQAFASLIYGWYGGLVYFTPILGGLIADRWLGAKRTVVLGALMMAAGHLAMSFDATFLIALVLLIFGSGCLKGNISAQVGTLYPPEAESMRARGFTVFATGINIGAVIGPLVAGSAADLYGFHAGFALAAALMLLALVTYLAGQRHLPETKRAERVIHPPLTAEEWRTSRALLVLIALTIPANIAYPMIWSIGLVWVDQHVSMMTPLGAVPATWFNAVDALASIAAAAPLIALWAWQARRGREPGSIAKIWIGLAITGASALFLTAGCLMAGADGRVSVLWALACWVGMGVGFMWYWPILLGLVSQAAPAKVNSTLMGACFLSLFVGVVTMGWVGTFYERMNNAAFWTLDAAIAFGGALLVLLVQKPLRRALEPA